MKPLLFRILYKLQILRLFPQFYFHYEVKKYINRNDVVIDIGANQGIYTRIFSDCVGKDGLVYAVEPVYKFWWNLSEIGNNVLLEPVALGNSNELIKMYRWRNTSGAYQPVPYWYNGGLEAEMVQGSRVFGDLLKINFIKIDVEGSELPIIEDMAELILKHKPTILIETGEIEKVLSFLPSYKIIDQLNNDYLICPKD